ncbi:helix-turn-helix domain-containing protein [Geotalea uraniireducens]|uniref:Helix-turn-helix domain protein n=1 Tax=Geotalea uraniireducens (strain Rf4) TaxID=351605 RepID=A5GA29_GEOUR|nr:helix-turn-helix transcriptional regulator [Geotalea uraniireducens]ABQ25559.1 helix-turn-helix domain protein [Geotalea uraniireducens Rf4]
MKEPITESSGNVFVDLGFDPAEAAILQMRAELMTDLREFIRSSGMTQMEAAQRLGVGQSRVSDLMRGKWDRFSLEMLITLEARAGRKVRLDLAA